MPAGSLALYRLHARTCPHRSKGRRWTRCNCAVWVQGSLAGKWVKKSLNTRDWSVAAATIHEWEAARADRRQSDPTSRPSRGRFRKYLEDAEARHLAVKRPSASVANCFEGKLLPYCESKGYERLADLNVDALARFSQDLEIRSDVGGQAPRVPARFLAVLRGVASGSSAIQPRPSSRRRSPTSRRCRSRTPKSIGAGGRRAD